MHLADRHLHVLHEKHKKLDIEISKLESHLATDGVDLNELKKQKLKLKDKINTIEGNSSMKS